MIRWLAALVLLPNLALAEAHMPDAFPVLGAVVDVAEDDVLNIRIDPTADSEIIGTLTPNAQPIELVAQSDDGRWGLVNTRESSGWISLRFFDVPAQPAWHEFAHPLHCAGTEPFWSFNVDAGAGATQFEGIDPPAKPFSVDWSSDIAARWVDSIAMGGGDLENGFFALIENQICHDGMSDRTDALRIRLYIHEAGGTAGFDGCCGIAP